MHPLHLHLVTRGEHNAQEQETQAAAQEAKGRDAQAQERA
jgi:hypothetical protein